MFAMITMTGIKLITREELTARNTSVVGLSVALGIGVIQAGGCLGLFPDWAKTVFGESAVVIASISAILLNQILPVERAESIQETAEQDTCG